VAREETVIQLITQRFDALDRRLDVMDAKNDQRDMRVNTMDANNKAEIASVKDDIKAAKLLWKVATIISSVVLGFFGWAISLIPDFWTAFHKSS
jgi:hypothetical protein